jgi:protocatechuate 3,4-dioxygenase alpha subunit
MMDMTGSQTVGPFLHIGLAGLYRDNLRVDDLAGVPVTIQGRVLDGDGVGVPDGMIEIWQANALGRYPDPQDTRDLPLEPGFHGFGRVATDEHGGFRFATIKPGTVPGANGTMQAPHIMVSVFMRGLIKRLATRVYFPDGIGHVDDPVLRLVPEHRRTTLIARAVDGDETNLEWNIVVQRGVHGYDETVFFDI